MAAPILSVEILPVNPWMMLPFVILLMAIAVGPFLHRQWWEKYYPHVSLGLGLLVCAYYGLVLDYRRMAETFLDYFSFIVLIGSLFVAAGGIFLHTERRATPLYNTGLLAIGALVSNLLGTTGASMLLIRPFLRINRPRVRGYHVIFFIFVVSNMGGALTPIGDPPLFLGYLNGVPFLWTMEKLWPAWIVGIGLVLAVFFFIDMRSYRLWTHEKPEPRKPAHIEIRGTQNFFFLFIILAAVFAATPVREFIMIAAAAAAHKFSGKAALRSNEFSFAPIKEVAILFAGIFATMVPALDWLSLNAGRLGIRTPGQYYWSTGILSSFLDNAPTYLNFLSAAMGLHQLTLGNPDQMRVLLTEHARFLQAVSIGAVFFGACSYIGNGPNFMVKSIAEHHGVKCPSFFGYIACYTMPILIPIFTLIWYWFIK
jgi:Na+/H+ antiporter NhaD/arsenite permease-like protein